MRQSALLVSIVHPRCAALGSSTEYFVPSTSNSAAIRNPYGKRRWAASSSCIEQQKRCCRECLHQSLPLEQFCRRMPLFRRQTLYGHAICITPVVFDTLHRYHLDGEPTPKFASDAEIKLATQLRHQLEQRYLETAAAPSSSNKDPQNRST